MRLLSLAFLALLPCISSCSAPPPPPLFPDAVEVRVTYGDGVLSIAHDGTIHASMPYVSGRQDVPTTEGGALTRDEIALLRRSITYSATSQPVAMCCFPRHAFVFFGKDHRVLGQLQVCFQCGCARIFPAPAHDERLKYLVWDEKAFASIVRAHHLPLQPKGLDE
jgi:hypothetical protein